MSRFAVLFHNDMDGFVAAWVARNHFILAGVKPDWFIVDHGLKIPDVSEYDKIYIFDYHVNPDTLKRWCKTAKDGVVLLDHHVTAEEKYRNIPLPDNAKVIFDMNSAGCLMAWKYFAGEYRDKPPQEPPLLVKYVNDHDLWKFELDSSRQIRAFLHSYDVNFNILDDLDRDLRRNLSICSDVGNGILRFSKKIIAAAVEDAQLMEFEGYRCLGTEMSIEDFKSDVASKLAEHKDYNFGVCFYMENGMWKYSLRSHGDFDVSKIAQLMNGGGHKNAAGFTGDSPDKFFVQEK